MLDRISHEVRTTGELQLAENVSHVVLGRLGGYEELPPDLAIRVAARDKLQYLSFSSGDLVRSTLIKVSGMVAPVGFDR